MATKVIITIDRQLVLCSILAFLLGAFGGYFLLNSLF